MARFGSEEVFGDVRGGPKSRVKGTRVQGPLRAVGTVWAGGQRAAGLPLRGAVGASQDGKYTVLPLGRGRGLCDGGRAAGFDDVLLSAHLLLLDLQEGLL